MMTVWIYQCLHPRLIVKLYSGTIKDTVDPRSTDKKPQKLQTPADSAQVFIRLHKLNIMGKDNIKVTSEILQSLPKSQYSEQKLRILIYLDLYQKLMTPRATQSFIGALRMMLTRRIGILSTNHPRGMIYIHIFQRDWQTSVSAHTEYIGLDPSTIYIV